MSVWEEPEVASKTLREPSIEPDDMWGSVAVGAPRNLLLAGLDAFCDLGFDRTTTRDISAGAGVSPAALYVHYRSKEELLFVISRIGHQTALELVRNTFSAKGDPAELMFDIAHKFTSWHARNHRAARIFHREWAALSEDHRKAITAIRHKTHSAVKKIIEDGIAAGQFNVMDPRGATFAILSLGIDVNRWYRPNGPYTPDELGNLYAQLSMNLLGFNRPPQWQPEVRQA